MPVNKAIDSTQLDADLTSVANAIRTKGGTAASLAFPAGFVSAIGDIPSGDTVFYAPRTGRPFVKDTVINVAVGGDILAWMIPNLARTPFYFAYATELESYEIHTPAGTNVPFDNSFGQMLFYKCTNLKSAVFDMPMTSFNAASAFTNCTSLKSVQLGGLGKPWTGSTTSNNHFTTCTALTSITIYVNAATLADIPSNITTNAPFGATNASVTYRNSNTGEVITA